ncbi:hypothetical protein CR513_05126, partial [Mucuna pruriens]
MARRSKREVGRGVTLGALVLSHDTAFIYQRNTFPPQFRHRGVENEDELRVNLDLLQKAREEYATKAKAARRQRRKLAPDSSSTMTRVTDKVDKGAYRLEQLNGKKIPWTWNALNL